MKRVTYVAGVAVAAMIAMAAMPNEAAAIPSGSFNFGPVGDVLFDGSANIPAAPTQKTYEAASVNNNGKGVFCHYRYWHSRDPDTRGLQSPLLDS